MERGHGDIAIGDRFEVGRVTRRLNHRRQAEPVIIIASGIGPLDDLDPAIVAQPRTTRMPLTSAAAIAGKLTLTRGSRVARTGEQRRRPRAPPTLRRSEGHGVAHPFSR